MLRFAPSPTGDLHIENLRVALFNYIVARQRNEELVVRIEDTDKKKNIDGKDQEILDILDMFDIKYSHTVYQSENIKYHRQMAIQLLQDKRAFNCFCTPETLDAQRAEAKANKKTYRYDDHCTELSPEQTIDNNNPFVIRMKKPKGDITIEDKIKGKLTFTPDEIDSFIIMGEEKFPTYNFACAVDDMLSDISLVIREEEHMDNTPRQAVIRNALGYTTEIEYAHLPKIADADALSIKSLFEEGYLPSAIANYLISIGNNVAKEIFTLDEAIEFLDLEKISKSSVKFDISVLKNINRQHMSMLDDKELSKYVGFADAQIGALAKAYLDEVETLVELRSKIEPIFKTKEIPLSYKENTDLIKDCIKKAPYFEGYSEFEKYVMTETGLKGEDFLKPLRFVLTGTENGPDLSAIYNGLKDVLMEVIK